VATGRRTQYTRLYLFPKIALHVSVTVCYIFCNSPAQRVWQSALHFGGDPFCVCGLPAFVHTLLLIVRASILAVERQKPLATKISRKSLLLVPSIARLGRLVNRLLHKL
jgi:hypothetical protein